jgi:hypothetical protein
MKWRMATLLLVLALLALVPFTSLADKPIKVDSQGVEIEWRDRGCTTIQDGQLLTSDGNVITTGFDQWGYNYQVHMFNGTYCDAYHVAAWCKPWKDVELSMK